MLLNVVCGLMSYDDIRTVNEVIQPMYKEACLTLGILESDGEWHEAQLEASNWAIPVGLRVLFVTFMFCQVSDLVNLSMRNRVLLCDVMLMV